MRGKTLHRVLSGVLGALALALLVWAPPAQAISGPEVKIGVIPGSGGTQRFLRAVGKYKAMRYVLTGDVFDARQASDMGLVSEVVPDAEVEKYAVGMATRIAELSPLAIQQAKEAMLRGMDSPLETALVLEAKAGQILFSSMDQKEGANAFLEKRKPRFQGK